MNNIRVAEAVEIATLPASTIDRTRLRLTLLQQVRRRLHVVALPGTIGECDARKVNRVFRLIPSGFGGLSEFQILGGDRFRVIASDG